MVLSSREVVAGMLAQIRDVAAVFRLPDGQAKRLLEHMRWNKDQRLERFYDGDAARDKLLADAGVAVVVGGALEPFDDHRLPDLNAADLLHADHQAASSMAQVTKKSIL